MSQMKFLGNIYETVTLGDMKPMFYFLRSGPMKTTVKSMHDKSQKKHAGKIFLPVRYGGYLSRHVKSAEYA